MYYEINDDEFSESFIKKAYYKLNKEFGVFHIGYLNGFRMWFSCDSDGETTNSGSKSVKYYKLSLKTSFSLS